MEKYECLEFTKFDEVQTFMARRIDEGWKVKEHHLLVLSGLGPPYLVSVVFEK
jgi:hypothetical protein